MEVIIDGVEYVPVVDKPLTAKPFQVGDFVQVIEVGYSSAGLSVGDYGKVVVLKGTSVGVEFPGLVEGHDLGGATRPGHGRWFDTNEAMSRDATAWVGQLVRVL